MPAPLTKGRAQTELRVMRSTLKRWLKARAVNDASGSTGNRDLGVEQRLASNLHRLLSELFDAAALPSPDVSRDPEAAARLATIAVTGALPEEAGSLAAQGAVWMWPAVATVGILAVVLAFKINTDAKLALEQEELQCRADGKCMDPTIKYALWAAGAYVAWTQLGLREWVQRRKTRSAASAA